MEIVVMIIMILVVVSFVMKLTWHSIYGIIGTAVVAAVFVRLTCGYAADQSRTQIADWLSRPELMLDTSVLLTLDVAFQIAFCILMAKRLSGEKMPRLSSLFLQVTGWFPGVLIFPVLFSVLVEVVFSFPGNDFAVLGWITAAIVAVLVTLLAIGMKSLLPDGRMRLELMFLVNGLIAILGVISTVNGRTAVNGTTEIEWDALAGVLAIAAAGAIVGVFVNKRVTNKYISKIK